MQQHWIIRVNDGKNFRNSTLPFWGVKSGKNNCIKTVVSKINKGDVLWFLTSKKYGAKMIGMAEYSNYSEVNSEDITKQNQEQKWEGNEEWNLQLHYCNALDTEERNISACIQCCGTILEYDTFKLSVAKDLHEEYKIHKTMSIISDDEEDSMLDETLKLLFQKKEIKNNIRDDYSIKINKFPTLKDEYIKLQNLEIKLATEKLTKQIKLLSDKLKL